MLFQSLDMLASLSGGPFQFSPTTDRLSSFLIVEGKEINVNGRCLPSTRSFTRPAFVSMKHFT